MMERLQGLYISHELNFTGNPLLIRVKFDKTHITTTLE